MEMTQLEKRLVNRESHSRTNIKIMEWVFEQLNLAGIQRVLEVGCGIGMVSAYLAEKYGMTVTGTDYDPQQIALAKQKFPENENLQFRAADATNLPFGDGEFDLALSFKVLHHIGNWEQALREISRVLRLGRYYLLDDLTFRSETMVKLLRGIFKNYGVYTVEGIISELTQNGCEIAYREKRDRMIFQDHTMLLMKREMTLKEKRI